MGNLWLYAHPAVSWTVIAVAAIGITGGIAGLIHYRQR